MPADNSYPIDPPVPPMLATLSDQIPEGGDVLYEPKWDGFRAIVFRGADDLYIQSRDSKPLDRYFPELEAEFRTSLPARCVVACQHRASQRVASWWLTQRTVQHDLTAGPA